MQDTVGKTVQRARLRKGLTLRQLHDLTGVAIGAINRLEKGHTRAPHGETLRRIAPALGLDFDDLLDQLEAEVAEVAS